MLRVDQVIHNTNRVFARYSTDRNRENDASPFPALGSAFLEGPATDFEISLTSSMGPHIVNEALYNELPGQYRGYALLNGQGVAMDQAAGIVPSTLAGLISPGAGTFPIFGLTNYLGGDLTGQFGDGRPKGQNRYIYEWVDNLTWEKGRHLMKVGTMIEDNKALLFDSRTSDGSYSFTGAETSKQGAPPEPETVLPTGCWGIRQTQPAAIIRTSGAALEPSGNFMARMIGGQRKS